MTSSDLLRSRAEDVVRMTRRDVRELSRVDVDHLLHELQIHQVELEMQHESIMSTQRDLEQSRELFQELFDCAPVGYVMLDTTGAIAHANTAALSMFGKLRARLIGQPLASLVSPADLELLDRHMSVAGTDAPPPVELRLRAGQGDVTHVRLDTSRLSGSRRCLVVMTDISDRVRDLEAEQRLHLEREADLVERLAELEARNRRLEADISGKASTERERLQHEERTREAERLQSLGMLAAGIAHDFNNLLVGVLGNADLLLQTPELAESWRAPLTVIKRAGRSASDLTRQLLVFAGMGRLSLAPVSFTRVVSDAVDLIRANLPPGIRLESRIAPDLPFIMADRGQAFQVVMNLVTNAIEAVSDSGRIAIGLRCQRLDEEALAAFQPHNDAAGGEFVVLTVEDDGEGIDAAALTRIFDPFFTTKFTGRGLGLATALGIVQSHHGAMRVRSRHGEGTSFDVAFPRADKHRDSDRPARDPDWIGSGTVLLVDDDDMVRKVVGESLVVLGFDVTSVKGGAEALETLNQTPSMFDFVVLDWLMPEVSGDQVLRALRGTHPELPVILISGFHSKELAPDDLHVARVQKPMTLADLRDAVNAVLGPANELQLRVPPLRPVKITTA